MSQQYCSVDADRPPDRPARHRRELFPCRSIRDLQHDLAAFVGGTAEHLVRRPCLLERQHLSGDRLTVRVASVLTVLRLAVRVTSAAG